MGRPAWTRLLARSGGCEMVLRGETVRLVPLPARTLLTLEAEAEEGAGDSPFARALRGSAALAAKCLQNKDGKALFSDAEEVLEALTAEEINAVAARYKTWSRAWDPSYGCSREELAALKKA